AVTVFARDRLVTLELATGEPVAAPVALPAGTVGPLPHPSKLPRFFDPAGNGELAFLSLEPIRDRAGGTGSAQHAVTLGAHVAATGRKLWEVEHEGLSWERSPRRREHMPPPDWPL